MKDKYYIHIGPPKTATSSFQRYFLNLEVPDFNYEGIKQPRNKNNSSLCQTLYEQVNKQKPKLCSDILASPESESNVRLLSEEMFLVNSPKVTWQDKMTKLYELTKNIEVTLLIVLRDPINAIRSYYQELYYILDKSNITTIDEFAESNYCSIYNYDILINTLHKIGYDNIELLDFKKLINGQYSLNNLFDVKLNQQINLTKNNKSKISNNSYYPNNYNLNRVIRDIVPSRLINLMKGNKLSHAITSYTSKIKIDSRAELDVNLNSKLKKEFINSYTNYTTQTI